MKLIFYAYFSLLSSTLLSQYIAPMPDPREDLRRPSSLQAIRRRYFPSDVIPYNSSEIEEVFIDFSKNFAIFHTSPREFR